MGVSQYVAPYVGAWIETSPSCPDIRKVTVAPYVGAWIETPNCGEGRTPVNVAPYVGAWIETSIPTKHWRNLESRTLCGCVD